MNRSRNLNNKNIGSGPILYWMDRDMRASDNRALIFAQEKALELKKELIVMYNLVPGFLGGIYRNHEFKVNGLKELENIFAKNNISFFIIIGEEKEVVDFINKKNIGYVITDFSPLKIQRKWKKYVSEKINVLLTEVDAHNIIPAWILSNKSEIGARTIRPKIARLLPQYLEEFPKLKKQKVSRIKKDKIDWNKILDNKNTYLKSKPYISEEKGGRKILRKFLDEKIYLYGENRNDPLLEAQSQLSPYLHYGMISAERIVLEVMKKFKIPKEKLIHSRKNKAVIDGPITKQDSILAFLEELIVRRELSDNFCLYNPKTYDTVECFPSWAKKSLSTHLKDKREYTYNRKQFEDSKTHDDLWNACQREMVMTGKMHGYMRMYWAKKILEWTNYPEEAMKIAIYLNDKYEMDGRDPNGYAGIAWSMGGVHDRPWFNRPIFGLVRYMAKSGCEKKFDVKKYIKKYK